MLTRRDILNALGGYAHVVEIYETSDAFVVVSELDDEGVIHEGMIQEGVIIEKSKPLTEDTTYDLVEFARWVYHMTNDHD